MFLREKVFYFIIISVMLLVIFQPFVVIGNGFPEEGRGLRNPLDPSIDTLDKFVEAISKIVITVGGVLATIFIIWSGYLFVTSRGNEEQLKKAKSVFMWTIIGTAVLLGAYVISEAVVNFVQGLK